MEPLLIILVPGVLGGAMLALLIRFNWRRAPSTVVPRRLEAPTPTLINMAHIKVEGVGGLGMVAVVVIVALSEPSIRLATIVGAVLGAALALVLIAKRRHDGGLPSVGDGPGDRSVLGLDADPARKSMAGGRETIEPVAFGRRRLIVVNCTTADPS
ncbi:MAG: hypothetical protein ABJC89_05770 [Acidobacteriota bacterium]